MYLVLWFEAIALSSLHMQPSVNLQLTNSDVFQSKFITGCPEDLNFAQSKIVVILLYLDEVGYSSVTVDRVDILSFLVVDHSAIPCTGVHLDERNRQQVQQKYTFEVYFCIYLIAVIWEFR